MSALWVLLVLVPLVALALLAGAAGLTHQREDVEPEWWPEFERDFRLYAARTTSGRDGGATWPPRPSRRSRLT